MVSAISRHKGRKMFIDIDIMKFGDHFVMYNVKVNICFRNIDLNVAWSLIHQGNILTVERLLATRYSIALSIVNVVRSAIYLLLAT